MGDDQLPIDPLLKEQKSASSEGLEFSFVGLLSPTIDTIDACVNLIWVLGNYNKNIKPREIIINAQSVFKDEDLKLKDTFWKEHCSSSLRELVDNHFEQNCKRFLKCIPDRNNSTAEKELCESIGQYKEFLNDFAHFKKTALPLANKILGESSSKEISSQNFDKICTGFISQLELFFKYKKR